jgi:hypothetical protein
MGRRAWQRANLIHAAAQAGVGASIIAALIWVYRDNPGYLVEWHLDRNLHFPFGVLANVRLVVLVGVIALSAWSIRRAPAFIACGLLATLPALVVAAFFFGYIDELRDYYEALPFVVAMGVIAMGAAAGKPERAVGGRSFS